MPIFDDDALPVLGFARAVFRKGRNTTVRRGTRWLGVPRVRLQFEDGRLSPPVALETEARPFRDLDAHALRDEHDPACRTPSGLFAELARHYPGFSEDETVTLCHFER